MCQAGTVLDTSVHTISSDPDDNPAKELFSSLSRGETLGLLNMKKHGVSHTEDSPGVPL